MKSQLLSLGLLLFPIAVSAEEPNPFVRKSNPAKPPDSPAGAGFTNLVEYFNVPSGILDEWLQAHPLQKDATALRQQTQRWVSENKASLEHTSLTSGTMGRDSENTSILEQLYPTEYNRSAPGTWPYPTAYETRNLGFSSTGGSSKTGEESALNIDFEVVSMIWPQRCWDPLADKTRKPADIFQPLFWSFRSRQVPPTHLPVFSAVDPFTDVPNEPSPVEQRLVFPAGKTYLAGRTDQTQMVNEPSRPRMSRLVFFHGSFAAPPASASKEMVPELFQVSAKIVTAPHADFSAWLQEQDLAAVPSSAWSLVEPWIKDSRAGVINELTAYARIDANAKVDAYTEVSYPTEWNPAKATTAKEGEAGKEKSMPEEPSFPGAGETRNIGSSLEAGLSADSNGLLLQVSLNHVAKAGDSVFRRIESKGEWIPDITYPLFMSARISTPLRIERGKWMLAGSGSGYLPDGKPDSANVLLMFVKVE